MGHSHSSKFGGLGSFSVFRGWTQSFQNIWWDTVVSWSFGWATVILKILVGHGHFQAFVVGQSFQNFWWVTVIFQAFVVGHSHSKDFGGPRSFSGFCGWTQSFQNFW